MWLHDLECLDVYTEVYVHDCVFFMCCLYICVCNVAESVMYRGHL